MGRIAKAVLIISEKPWEKKNMLKDFLFKKYKRKKFLKILSARHIFTVWFACSTDIYFSWYVEITADYPCIERNFF